MEFKGTKGEWGFLSFSTHFEIIDSEGNIIAQVGNPISGDLVVEQANAGLIAAAPELLGALKGYLQSSGNCLESHKDSISDKIFWEGQVDRLSKVIKKAL